jgi:hypothetical protein
MAAQHVHPARSRPGIHFYVPHGTPGRLWICAGIEEAEAENQGQAAACPPGFFLRAFLRWRC